MLKKEKDLLDILSYSTKLNRRIDRKGFTLVELLVVLGIISVLIAILLPSLMSARQSADLLKCKSNISQVCKAQMAYQVDCNVYAPIWIAGTGEVSSEFLSYMQADINDLEDASSALNCVKVDQDEIDRVKANAPAGVGVASYGLNPGIVSRPEWDYDPNKVPNPSQYILVAEQPVESSDLAVTSDGNIRQTNPRYSDDPNSPNHQLEPYLWNNAVSHDASRGYRHGKDAANAAFNDGHVEFLSHDELSMNGTSDTSPPRDIEDFQHSRWIWWTFIQSDGLSADTVDCGCGLD